MRNDARITLDHGAGGTTMRALISERIAARVGGAELLRLNDAAELRIGATKLAFTTDSYVVQPLFFPGGDIGKLAVCGTVNDLLVMGAQPLCLSLALILEEGFESEKLDLILESIGNTARKCNVEIVTGDTKVVPRGQCDQLFINTAGIGVQPLGYGLAVSPIVPGDAVIVSGNIGDHAVAILAARGTNGFMHEVESDCAPLVEMVASVLRAYDGVKWMRDATRGGVAAVLDELRVARALSLRIVEREIPVRAATRALCDLLGFDPLHLANEGKIVMIVDPAQADSVVRALRATEHGADAARIGTVIATDEPTVILETNSGGARKLRRPAGELLPRIC